jgi:PhzF family phenazine biosynthesis protein
MQSIAAENNLAETAFVVPDGDNFGIRWFTPTIEVDLCGHATLASGFVIFNQTGYAGDEITFLSPRSGILKVRRDQQKLYLDFPEDEITPCAILPEIIKGIGMKPLEVFRGKTDFMAILGSEKEVLAIRPDYNTIAKLDARGLIVTAPGDKVDFVSRFFGPQSGVNEDPVTGSAHTTLTPFWAKRLGKTELQARQISARGGSLECRYAPPRVIIGGEAQLYLIGDIFV